MGRRLARIDWDDAHMATLEALGLCAQLTAAATEHEQCELHLAFQVPHAQPSLAGLITTSRHQYWIEGFLAESARA
jgi:hypothetical protein